MARPTQSHTRFCITDRFGGVSSPPYDELNLGDHVGDAPESVAQNRRRLAERLGLPPEGLVFMNQVHGRDVVVLDVGAEGGCTTAGPGTVPDADALVTNRSGTALVVLVADCAPVLLACDQPPVVAVAHAGRRGLVAGVVPATVRAMEGLGAEPERINVMVGPAICGACYEVPVQLQADVIERVPQAAATTATGTPGIDVRAGVLAQLRTGGVVAIRVDPRCTREAPELYSYRRDGRTGRFAGIAWVHPALVQDAGPPAPNVAAQP